MGMICKIKEILFGTTTRKKREEQENNIIKCWKKVWDTDGPILDQNVWTAAEEDCFADWLMVNLQFLQSGQSRNRSKNFFMKGLSIVVFLVTYAALNWWNTRNAQSNLLAPILSLVPPYVVCQWINVKKYQETWSRLASYYGLLLQEMVKYIYSLQSYNESDTRKKKQIFIEQVLILTQNNGAKFYTNMTKKEKGLFSFSKIADKIKN